MTAGAVQPATDARSLRVLWLIPAALALHNAEEALTFPRYLPIVRERLPGVARPMAADIDIDGLRAALLWVTLLGVLVTAWAVRRPESRLARWCALVVQTVVAVNVVSHLIMSIVILRGYGPGLVTALLVNVPLSAYLFRRAWLEQWFAPQGWFLLLPAAAIVHGPGLLGLLMLA